ncbi:hypothetical protein RV134_210049 [Roseovarius sp. EC-HK134]|uniref:DUF2513 domain-containing protein n=1 Tax=unclassified Roseovarius TaxID=2614913 RepID=UPI00125463B7|nr:MULTISPECIES: DUF2513 domain-containing protein [unclassified Roseovarius]VVS99939.1 hypothetical protein RV134_210049 [Roseovarius sp. EC-HK134]VVT00621.1 hypothetical protein RV420_240049 [Roseovarius sp. EC-SD190]
MKLNLESLKEILAAVENCPSHQIDALDLKQSVLGATKDDAAYDAYVGHVRLLIRSDLLVCSHDDGFASYASGPRTPIRGATYELSMTGYQLLEGLRNQTIMGQIKTYLKGVGASGLKNAPGFVVATAIQLMLKG